MSRILSILLATLLLLVTLHSASATDKGSAQHLNNNSCFVQLEDSDKVIVTAAFHSGAEGFGELQQLIERKPWGDALTTVQREEIAKLNKEASPFLIMTLTKKQALVLEEHRDLIKWILVQSTTRRCE